MYNTALTVILVGASITQALTPEKTISLGEEKQIRPFLELCLDTQFSFPPVKKVSNVPNYIRDVPIHPDDPWGEPGAIAKDKADAPWLVEIRFLKLGFESELKESVVWRNYLDLSWNIGHWIMLGADVQKRNYTNAPGTEQRGYGAALTFWSPGYEKFIPGFRSEVHFKSKNGGTEEWFMGVGLRKYDVQIITGYDRWDRLDHRDHIGIGELLEASVYTGWKWSDNGDFRVGVNFNTYDERSKYRDIDVEVNKISPFIAFNIIWKF